MATLSDYLGVLRRLLNDPNDTFWPAADKTAYINQGIQRRDVDTGGNRQLFTYTLVVGQDLYTFTAIGSASVFDVVGVNLLYGNLRVVMESYSFTELNARIRQYDPPQQFAPIAWARYGPSSIYFAPAPSIAYDIEFDCCVYSPALVNATDADVLPYPYTEPVPYYAAILAKENERQYDEAYEAFQTRYRDLVAAPQNARTGLLRSAYS